MPLVQLASPVKYLNDAQFSALPYQERRLHVQRKYTDLKVHEQGGNNRGPVIDKWEAHWGLRGQAWCAIYQAIVSMEAGCPEDLLPKRPISVYGWHRYGEVSGRLVKLPQRTYVGYWLDLHGGDWLGHVFSVREVFAGGVKFATLEGNTGASGGRDGDGCYEKVRTIGELQRHAKYGFIHLDGVCP